MRSDATQSGLWAAGSTAGSESPPPPPRRPLVLVVEDEPAIRLLLCDVLADAGMEVDGADGAESALGVLAAASDAGERHRVLVTDVNLGRGLDGIALADLARRRVPDIRVLYVTGSPERVLRRPRAPGSGEHVVGKPFASAELAAKVRALAAPEPGAAAC